MLTIRVNASNPYDVSIGSGILDQLEARSMQAFVVCQPGSIAMAKKVSQVLENQKAHVQLFELPDGEDAKTLQSLGSLYEAAVEARLERSATVYAVGGGCVGDAAGFFAATYMRGIDVVQIPTTLLSMVDSGIGGKTGINVANTKNMAGAFWQPKKMVCDVSVLKTLPEGHMRNGLAEVIKHGLILDEAYFRFVEENVEGILSKEPGILEKTVAQSVRIKAAVVEKDEREADERMKLNYGHTVGHGIEAVAGLAHGSAISVGMAAEGDLSKKRGYLAGKDLERQNAVLEKAGLPRKAKASPDAVLEKMRSDKKRSGGKHTLVLLDRIGACHIEQVPEKDILRALEGVWT